MASGDPEREEADCHGGESCNTSCQVPKHLLWTQATSATHLVHSLAHDHEACREEVEQHSHAGQTLGRTNTEGGKGDEAEQRRHSEVSQENNEPARNMIGGENGRTGRHG